MAVIRSERGSGLTVGKMCRLVGISRPAFYRLKGTRVDRDLKVRAAMHDVALEFPWYGYRPMTVELRNRLSTRINEKRVRRLMGLDNLLGSRKTVRKWLSPKHGFPRYANLAAQIVPSRIDELWVADLTYVRLRSAFIFVAVILDAFSRRCIGWSIATYLRAELVIEALRMALRDRNVQARLIHHSDQGVQYACLPGRI
jgi:putative transposase